VFDASAAVPTTEGFAVVEGDQSRGHIASVGKGSCQRTGSVDDGGWAVDHKSLRVCRSHATHGIDRVADQQEHVLILGIGNGDSIALNCDREGGVQCDGGRRPGIADITFVAVAGDGRHLPAGDGADALVVAIGHIHRPGAIHGNAVGIRQLDRGSQSVGIESLYAGPGQRGDDARGEGDHAHALVVGIANVEIEGCIDCNAVREIEPRRRRQAAVTGKCLIAIARDGVDYAAGDLANAVVAGVREINIVLAIDSNGCGRVQRCRRGCGAIARESRHAGSGNGCNYTACNFADAVVVGIRYIDISGCVDSDTLGRVELCTGGRSAIAASSLVAIAGDGRKDAGQIHFPNNIVLGIGDEQVSSRIEGQT